MEEQSKQKILEGELKQGTMEEEEMKQSILEEQVKHITLEQEEPVTMEEQSHKVYLEEKLR